IYFFSYCIDSALVVYHIPRSHNLDQPDHTKVPVNRDLILVLVDFINAIYQKTTQGLWHENMT
ncbi:MAG: hypothetical protein KGI05_08825, partial [Thaumarchaeota archaeon]|nr:hypothetical protein [Nitrososphaerota archaeon]